MFTTIVNVGFALLVVALVTRPFLSSSTESWDPHEAPDPGGDLLRRKESAYSAIKELEFDYLTGKLSTEDFHELDDRYRREALDLIVALEKDAGRASLEETDDEASIVCEGCDTPVDREDDRFCATCGLVLAME